MTFSSKTKLGYAVAATSATILVTGLGGCSSHKGGTGAAANSSATNSSGTAVSARLVVDGRTRQMQSVECVTAANSMMANIGTDQDGIAVTTTAGDNPTLDSLVLGSFDGVPFGWHTTDETSRPMVIKSGQTYKIVGTAVAPAASGNGTLSKPFELDFTCPRR